MYTAVLLSKNNMNCHRVCLRKINALKYFENKNKNKYMTWVSNSFLVANGPSWSSWQSHGTAK
jgi:hypothetical protein